MLSDSAVGRVVTYSEVRDDAMQTARCLLPLLKQDIQDVLPLTELANVLIVDIDRPPPDAFVEALLRLQSS